MKKNAITIPSGLQLPQDANVKPFSLSGKFLVMGGKLVPLELGGVAVSCESEDEDYEEEEEYEKEEDGCCGAYKKGPEHMCPECPKKQMGFIVAVEKALKRS